MSLEHDGFTFFSGLHTPIVVSDPDTTLITNQFMGVAGESHLVGATHGRVLTCELTLSGYATKAALQADLDELANNKGQLTGTLTETVQAQADTFLACTFLGYSTISPPRYDGSGAINWWCVVRLVWRERAT